MADYKSAYTGQEIDSAIGKANSALQANSLKTINGSSIVGEGNIQTKDTYSIIVTQEGDDMYLSQEAIDYIYANKPEQIVVNINMNGTNITQIFTLLGKIDIENNHNGYMIYDTYNELSNKNTSIKIPKTASESVVVTETEYQEKLVSGENIKTINNQSLLGSGNINIQGGTDKYLEDVEVVTEGGGTPPLNIQSSNVECTLTSTTLTVSNVAGASTENVVLGYAMFSNKKISYSYTNTVGMEYCIIAETTNGFIMVNSNGFLYYANNTGLGSTALAFTRLDNSTYQTAQPILVELSDTTTVKFGSTNFTKSSLESKMTSKSINDTITAMKLGYSHDFRAENPSLVYEVKDAPTETSTIMQFTMSDETTIEVDLSDITIEPTTGINSIYKGKTISILGDSISTFAGYIPSGNRTYYNGTNCGVSSVNDTWWMKLINATGMTLNINNSWSGSYVTTNNGDESAGCMTRCQNLGTTPDVIIVWMGINDFINEVELGTYDGTGTFPVVTTTFREAYAIMLNKIMTAYPTSEVWVCTLPQCERNGTVGFPEKNDSGVLVAEYNEAIRELALLFGAKILENAQCGLTYQNMSIYMGDYDSSTQSHGLHPNADGHSLVANYTIHQMDNAVRTRY